MQDYTGVLKPLAVLELLADLQHSATLAELSLRLSVPKPTVHRWLGSLESVGLLCRTPDGRRYELAKRASQLAFSILANQPNSSVRHEILRHVVEQVGEACNLTVFDGTQVTYIDRVEATWPLRITFQQGSNVPAYCSASGKLFLALMQPAKRDLVLSKMPLERHTDNTIVDKATLLKELTSIRKHGYAFDREELLPGLVCIAVPIHQKKGRLNVCVAAVALQAPVTRTPHTELLKKLPILQTAAANLARTLVD